MKMFNPINIGEHAGSGAPNIFNVWEDDGWEELVIEERFDPDRTVLSLPFVKKATEKSDGKIITNERLFSLLSVLDIVEICPVAFEIYERLKAEYRFRRG